MLPTLEGNFEHPIFPWINWSIIQWEHNFVPNYKLWNRTPLLDRTKPSNVWNCTQQKRCNFKSVQSYPLWRYISCSVSSKWLSSSCLHTVQQLTYTHLRHLLITHHDDVVAMYCTPDPRTTPNLPSLFFAMMNSDALQICNQRELIK